LDCYLQAARKNQLLKDRAEAKAREKEHEDRARRMKEHEERIRLERRRRQEAKRRADAAASELKLKKEAESKAKLAQANQERQERLDRERRERIKKDRAARAKRESERQAEAERMEAESQAREKAVAAKRAERMRREKEQRDKAARIREENAHALKEKVQLKKQQDEQQRKEQRAAAAAAAMAAAKEEEAMRKKADEIGAMATVKLSVLKEDEILDDVVLPGAAYEAAQADDPEHVISTKTDDNIPDEPAQLPGAEMSMMRRLGDFKKPAQSEAPNAAEATMMRRLGAFKKPEPVEESDGALDPAAEATMIKRLHKFKVARLALDEEQPEPLSPGGLARERREREEAEAEMAERVQRYKKGEKKGINTLMLEVNGIQEANRVAMDRSPHNSPRGNVRAPMSPRVERDNLRQRARSARDAEEHAARQRVQEAKRQKELVIERKQGLRQNAPKPGASVYERRQAQKVEQLQAAHAAGVAREEKLLGWKAKQQEKKEAKEREEMEHKMRLLKMRENNARRESDVKDLIKKARAEAGGAAKNDEVVVLAAAPQRRVQPPAPVFENEEVAVRRQQRDDERSKIRDQRRNFMAAQKNAQPDFELVLEAPSHPKASRPSKAASDVPFEMVLKPEQESPESEEVESAEEESDMFLQDRQAAADAAAEEEANVVLAGSLWTEEAGAEVPKDNYEVQVESEVDIIEGTIEEAAVEGDNEHVQEAGEEDEPEWSREDDEYLELVETMRDLIVDQNEDADILILEDDDDIRDQHNPSEGEMDAIGRLVHDGKTLLLPHVSNDDSLCYQIESLRIFLEDKLGEDRFIEVYRLLEDMENSADEDAVTKEVAGLLGANWKEPFQMVVRLLLCEDQLNR